MISIRVPLSKFELSLNGTAWTQLRLSIFILCHVHMSRAIALSFPYSALGRLAAIGVFFVLFFAGVEGTRISVSRVIGCLTDICEGPISFPRLLWISFAERNLVNKLHAFRLPMRIVESFPFPSSLDSRSVVLQRNYRDIKLNTGKCRNYLVLKNDSHRID